MSTTEQQRFGVPKLQIPYAQIVEFARFHQIWYTKNKLIWYNDDGMPKFWNSQQIAEFGAKIVEFPTNCLLRCAKNQPTWCGKIGYA